MTARSLRAVVGIGANLGDRLATMRRSVRELGRIARVVKTSRVYETAPVGGPPQPPFLNAAALVEYEGPPLALLDALLAIEAEAGRVRRERWGPRTLDLDLLWVEGLEVNEERLAVPHPRLAERAFALVPMLALVPDARDPRTGALYAERLADLPDKGDVRDTGDEL